jgi:hypothetical protein
MSVSSRNARKGAKTGAMTANNGAKTGAMKGAA